MSGPLLAVENLRSWFSTDQGTGKAVDGVSFAVREGESVGIVGESGCGKTVTALSILGLLPRPRARIQPGSSVRFRGEELVGAPEARLRSLRGNEVAMVFQEPATSLDPVYSVGDQIGEALRVHRGMSRKEARVEVSRLLDEVGISDAPARARAYPHELSGGMRQRVMIAMALACEPSILIADEPTTALDVTIQAQILELLADVRRRRGMAILLITHDLGVVAEACDRVVVMYAGQVVESGTVRDAFESPRHPYTRGLLDSLPAPHDPERRLVAIAGSVPSAVAWPDGCRFRPRCPQAFGPCGRMPDLVGPDGSGRACRCWLSAGGEPAGDAP